MVEPEISKSLKETRVSQVEDDLIIEMDSPTDTREVSTLREKPERTICQKQTPSASKDCAQKEKCDEK